MNLFRALLICLATLNFVLPSLQAQEDKPDPEIILRKFADSLSAQSGFVVDVESTMIVRQNLFSQTITEKFTVAASLPNKLALRPRTTGITPAIICDGQDLLIFMPHLGQYLIRSAPMNLPGLFLPGMEAGSMARQALPFIEVLISQNPYTTLTQNIIETQYIGTEKIADKNCHKLLLIQQGLQWDFYVTVDEPVVLKKIAIETNSPAAQAALKAQWLFGNRRDANEKDFQYTPPTFAEKVYRFGGASEQHPLVGKTAPDFTLELIEGPSKLLSSHFKKDIVVLDFWATWCGPCRQALPIIEQVTSSFKDKSVVFYALNQNENKDTVKQYLNQAKLNVNVALDKGAAPKYQVSGIPQTVIIGKDGIVQSIHVGVPQNMRSQLTEELTLLTSGKSLVIDRKKFQLECTAVHFKPEVIKAGEKAQLGFTVKNSGDVDVPAGACMVILMINQEQAYFGPLPCEVAAGSETTCVVPQTAWSFQMKRAGDYKYQLAIDPEGSGKIYQNGFTVK